MTNPQQRELRRSENTAVTGDVPEKEMEELRGRPHGTDKGNKGGGRGGGTPPEQRPGFDHGKDEDKPEK